MDKQGELTGKFGEWLSGKIKDSTSFSVYYDHGDKNAHGNVVATKGFVGDVVKNVNRLADIDLLVVDSRSRIKMIIEIEERSSSPKKILGDVFSILLCNRFAVRQGGEQIYYDVDDDTKLIVAGVVPDKGGRLQKIKDVIAPRIRQFTSPFNGVKSENVSLIFTGNIHNTMGFLKTMVNKLIGV